IRATSAFLIAFTLQSRSICKGKNDRAYEKTPTKPIKTLLFFAFDDRLLLSVPHSQIPVYTWEEKDYRNH
ncbi:MULTISPECIES: hypothetical protein, partial [unclassified Klebsiella]|uniref:hypothetical protein n=1 Tax=unclassified Klebsiella TaxID=2608929 RepID=UPI0029C38C0B